MYSEYCDFQFNIKFDDYDGYLHDHEKEEILPDQVIIYCGNIENPEF